MKVGILSMQRILNYGSILQAYALKKSVEDIGYSTSFLDIKKGHQLECHQSEPISNWKSISRLKRRFQEDGIDLLHSYRHKRNYQKKFQDSFLQLLDLPEEPNTEGEFDVVIIGSDEVFNFAQDSWWGFTDQLFGKGINAKKVISYAASFGWTTWEDIVKHQLIKNLQEAFKNFYSISVRDENTYLIIETLTHTKPLIHLDPTMIYDFDLPSNFSAKDYIVLYSYSGRMDSPEEVKIIREFARKLNKKIISLGFYHKWCDENLIPQPFDFLNYFRHADYVITDTFHGTVFSILFNKQFCTVIRDSNSQKISYLLTQFKLESRRAAYPEEIPIILNASVDFSETNYIREKEKEKANRYLKNAIPLQEHEKSCAIQKNA